MTTDRRRITVFGAGAVGGYFGACLARAGHDVELVARGANLEALRASGIRVTGAMGDFAAAGVRAAREAAEPDLVLLSVKNYDLPEAARALSGARLVLTLQNGVEAAGRAREVLGDIVLAGTTGIVADLPEPGHVHVTSSYAWIRFGEPDGGGLTKRAGELASVLDVEGIEATAVEDARVALWEKMSLMCGMAGLTTLYQRPMGELLVDPQTRARFETIVRESEAVARAKGVPLPADFFEQRISYALRIDPSAMSSMSRDFARGRRIELDTFNGAIVRMGSELGIDVPANRAVYEALAAAPAQRVT